jgi:hypothetical protein
LPVSAWPRDSAAIAYNRHPYLCYELSTVSCNFHPQFGSGPRPPIRLARPNRMVFSTHEFPTVGQYNIAHYFVVNVRESCLPASKTSLEDCLKLSRIRKSTIHVPKDSSKRNKAIAAISMTNRVHVGEIAQCKERMSAAIASIEQISRMQ